MNSLCIHYILNDSIDIDSINELCELMVTTGTLTLSME